MSSVKIRNTSIMHHLHTSILFIGCIAHCILSLKKMNLIIKKKKKHALRRPYRTCARARVMGEVEEVQEQMKADMEAMKEQMAIMIEAMMSMKKIMEANAIAVTATNAVAKVNPMPPSGLMQSYPARALARRLQVYWARDPRKGPRVLMSLRVDFEPMG